MRKRLTDCKPDEIVLQQVATTTLETLKEQDLTGKGMHVTLTGNITDLQDTYANHRTITISFEPNEVVPFLQLAASDIEAGYEALFNKYATTVRAFETPKITITFK